MAEVDDDLIAGLKLAKTKELCFAFVGPESKGKLILAEKAGAKVPKAKIDAAKKELKSNAVLKGICTGPLGDMVFKVKKPKNTLVKAIKTAVFNDTKLTVKPDIQQLLGPGDDDDDDDTDSKDAPGAAPAGSAPAGAPAAAPVAAEQAAPPAAQTSVLGVQKLLQKLGFDPGKIDGIMGANTQAAIKKFQGANGLPANGSLDAKTQAALAKAIKGGAGAADGAPAGGTDAGGAQAGGAQAAAPKQAEQPAADGPAKDAAGLDYGFWQNARQNAITDLKALAAKIAAAAKAAGTKPADAGDVLKEINAIIAMLPPRPGPQEIDKLAARIGKDDAISAAEECPKSFYDLNIRKPLLAALEQLKG